MTARPRIGLALGGGAARGWAHIGVIRALTERGLVPDVVSGASIGSLVGAALAADRIDALEEWVLGLRRLDVLKLLDARLGGGVIEGNRVMGAIEDIIHDRDIDALPIPFGAVATDLQRGRTVWLREGSVIEAVRASCAMPGLFPPRRYADRWLVDGGLVDPVPVTLCRMLGAELVIAVNLSAYRHRPGPRLGGPTTAPTARSMAERDDERQPRSEESSYVERLQQFVQDLFGAADEPREPALLDVVSGAINIMQERVTRSRLAGDPPELEITPDLSEIGLMDFHRAKVALKRGVEAVARHGEDVDRLLQDAG
jgi:NTE family protein